MIFLVIGILLVLAGLLFATVLRGPKGLIAVVIGAAAIVPGMLYTQSVGPTK